MATYAIGDIQGCFDTFQALLRRIGFDPSVDRLWVAGDLVNRGPKSLETLRWMHAHDAEVRCVLGNHDLYLLARHAGLLGARGRDTVAPVLEAPDRDELLSWLRYRPLLHAEGRFVMVHAGILPRWSIEEAKQRARAIEAALRDPGHEGLLGDVRRRQAALDPATQELQRDLAVLTRMRMLRRDGEPEYAYNGPPEAAPSHLVPWYAAPHRRGDHTVVFGHWAALGLRIQAGMVALDSGCVWGHHLSAYRLEDGQVFQEPAQEAVVSPS